MKNTATAEDVKTVLAYADKCRELHRFIDEEFDPAADRLKAAGYPGAAWIECVVQFDPLEGGAIFDNLEAVQIANGQPGVADWLIGRITYWHSIDEVRGELDDSEAAAVAAFDRKFAETFPELEGLISEAVRESQRIEVRNAANFKHLGDKYEQVEKVLGHSLEDIALDVRKAVATMTGATAR